MQGAVPVSALVFAAAQAAQKTEKEGLRHMQTFAAAQAAQKLPK